MSIQLFADGGGMYGQDAALILSGFVGESKTWKEFAEQWRSTLDEAPKVSYFKMYEAVRLCGQFAGWMPSDRDRKVKRLAQVLNRSESLCAIHCTIDLLAIHNVVQPQ